MYGGFPDHVVGACLVVAVEQEVPGRDPLGGDGVSLVLGQPFDDQLVGRCLAGQLGVGVEQVKRPDGRSQNAQVSAVRGGRLDEPLDDGDEEGPGPAGGFDEDLRPEIPVRRVAHEVEDEIDDPAPGEDLAVVRAGIRGDLKSSRRVSCRAQVMEAACHEHRFESRASHGRSSTVLTARTVGAGCADGRCRRSGREAVELLVGARAADQSTAARESGHAGTMTATSH